ncbi:hypothetical protein GY45DRAFT_1437943 [Cubamyces sp. BRFM 1775]|nr:hypothetical protein GY45DRAFT_1437943 [Cubamyces sp. BRFM 1775]
MSDALAALLFRLNGVNIYNTYGAYLLGTCASLILYGVSLHQLYRYFRLYPTDTLSIRTLVVSLMALETLQASLLIHSCYSSLVSNYFNPSALMNAVWSLKIEPVVVALITLVAQAFFARRASLLGTRSLIVTGIAILALMLHLSLAIAAAAIFFRIVDLHRLKHSSEWLFSASVSSATVADILLAGTIIRGLRRTRATLDDSSLDGFTLYVVNTGLLTGIFNAIPAILAACYPRSFLWAAFNFIPARLYANTLLSVLNSRKFLVGREIKIFGPDPSSRGIIARAGRLATVERWGAPPVPDQIPAIINISVTAEQEDDMPSTTDSIHKLNSGTSTVGMEM